MFDLRGVILAGGASRRMGQDKATIDLNGATFLTQAISLLETVGAASIVVLGRPDLPHGVPDRAPLSGPATALVDYLSTMPDGSRHLVLPVDMPALSTAALSRLLMQQDWACFEGHMLPMLAIGGDKPEPTPRRLRDLLNMKKASCLSIRQADRHGFVNLNTPDELHHWRQITPQEGVREHV